MSRGSATALKDPTPQAAATLAARRARDFAPLHRAQFDQRGPWWWTRRPALGEGGRVDLAAPDGTLYFATSATRAVIEKVWDPDAADPTDPQPQLVLRDTLERIIVWQAQHEVIDAELVVTDLTDSKDGLPKEFSTADYTVTQAWADTIRGHSRGQHGVVYWLRLDPADGRAVALFADGPDDDAPGFAEERFALRASDRAIAVADELPTHMFRVVDRPADADMSPATLDAI